MQRGYSVIDVKSVDEKRRVVSGIATTPRPDRVGDIVEPMGAKFQTPLPLFLYHSAVKPVGNVFFANPKKTGIPFEAELPDIAEEGVVRERVNEAWHSLKYNLIRACSIGFQPINEAYKVMENGGIRFLEWEWLELSLVTIPMNPDAVLNAMKSMDAQDRRRCLGGDAEEIELERAALVERATARLRAASGQTKPGVVRALQLPGASGDQQAACRPGVVRIIQPKP